MLISGTKLTGVVKWVIDHVSNVDGRPSDTESLVGALVRGLAEQQHIREQQAVHLQLEGVE